MRKFRLLLALIALLCGLQVSFAEVAPYTMDFNKTISTYGDWVVGTGWGHFKDPDGNTPPTYNHYSWYGVDRSGALSISAQNDGYDLLVTPSVKGKISIQVSRLNGNVSDSYIEVYQMGSFLGAYMMGDEILGDKHTAEINEKWTGTNSDSYITIDIPEQDEYVKLGLRCNNICIDNFKADSADVDLVKSVSLSYASISTTNFDLNQDGNIPVKLSVNLSNTGDLDIEQNEENFTYSVFAIIGTEEKPLIENKQFSSRLANGSTIYEYPEFEINPEDYLGADGTYSIKLKVKENFSGTEREIAERQFTPIPFEPVMIVSTNYSGVPAIENGGSLIYPPTKTNTYVYLYVRNDGGAPLEISSIDLPDGWTFSNSYTFPMTINAHNYSSLSLLLPSTTAGVFNGDFTIQGNAGDLTMTLGGTVVGQNQFFLDGYLLANIIYDSNVWSSYGIYNMQLPNNSSALLAKGESPAKLITPLLKVSEGEKLTFSAARRDSNPNLNVYYSQNRKDWTLAKTIEPDELSSDIVYEDTYAGNQLCAFSDFEAEIPVGNYYIAFESSSILLDNVLLGEEVPIEGADVAIKDTSAETEATVNTPWSMGVGLYNTTSVAVAANTYTATLYVNNVAVSQAEAVEIGGQRDTRFSFYYTPTEIGSKTAYVKFEGEDWEVETDAVEFTVVAESSNRIIQVGQHTAALEYAPFNLSSTYAEAEAIYTSEQLQLKPGTKITKIRYRGAFNTWANEFNQNISIWIENTEDASLNNNSDEPLQLHPTDDMTNVVENVAKRVTKRGVLTSTYPYSIAESATIFEFDLEEPFIYDGGNIRIVSTNASAGTTGSVYFEADGNITDMAMARNGWSLPLSSNFTLQPQPVVYFGVDSEPSVISGTVIDKDTNSPVSGLTITAQDDNGVTYTAETDEQGKYELSIFQDMHPYLLKITKDGYFPVKRTVTPAGESTEDFEIEAAKGLFIDELTLPANATKNYEMKVSATVLNPMAEKQAADYTATLLFADEPVATAEAVEVEAGENHTFTFLFTPHTTGDQELKVRIEHANEFVSECEPKTINVEEEMYEGRLQVSENTGVFQTYAPFYGRDYGTHAEMIIDRDVIPFETGTVIKSITFRGRVSGAETITKNMNVKAYIENTEDESLAPLAQFTPRDVEEMTLVMDATLSFAGGGSNDNPIDVLTITFNEGFEYSGNNMRLVLMTKNEATETIDAWWCNSNTHQSDNHVYVRTMGYNDWNSGNYGTWRDNVMGYPTMWMSIETFKTLDGTITGTGNVELAGAKVVLVSDNVEYEGETDSEGAYSIRVAQPKLDYTVTASLKGYRDATDEVSVKDGDNTWDAYLKAYYDNTYAANQRAAISLPFSLTAQEMTALGKFYVLEEVRDGKVYFSEAETVVANKPYVFEATTSGNLFEDFAATEEYAPQADVAGDVTFIGADDNVTLKSDAETTYYVMDASGNFAKATETQVEMFTAYLYGSNLNFDSLEFSDNYTSGIFNMENFVNGKVEVYTIDGRKLSPETKLIPGIYIVNGKKILVK